MKKVSVFVDVQNVYYTVKEVHNAHFNYNLFMQEITRDRELVKAFAYAIDKGDAKQIKFQKILETIGFEIKLKPFIKRSDGSRKGDWDVGITIDVLDYVRRSDIVVLASGDGDFVLLVEKIKKDFNVEVEIYGVPELTSIELINSANNFIAIDKKYLINRIDKNTSDNS